MKNGKMVWMRVNSKQKLVPFVGMVIAIMTQTSSMVVLKVAMTNGTDKYVIIVYSGAISTLILLFPAFLLHRSGRPPLTFSVLCSFFVLSLLGCGAQISAYIGIGLSSPTLAMAMMNLITPFTFILALIFRMEAFNWRHSSSQVKVLGTIISISGALVITFYKGPSILKPQYSSRNKLAVPSQLNWIYGALVCATEAFLASACYIYQAHIIKKYPALMFVAFHQVFFGTILSSVFSLFAVTNPRAWVVKLDMGLFAILYQAVIVVTLCYALILWCLQKTGPLFCAMFKPLGIVFTIIMSATFLGEDFHLGSLIGAVMIVLGLYGVMWGKALEEKIQLELGGGSPSFAKTVITNGMSSFVFIGYSNALASLVLFPCSFFSHSKDRGSKQPPFTLPLFTRNLFLGLVGITMTQIFLFVGLSYSSPILVCAMGHLIPACNFLLSVILRKMNFDLRSSAIRFQVLGTLISILGAVEVELFKGPLLIHSSDHQLRRTKQLFVFSSTPEFWILGGILLAAASFSVALWNFIQKETVKQYPELEAMKVVTCYTSLGTVLSAIVSLMIERDPIFWKLNHNMELILIVLTAIFGGVIRPNIQIWFTRMKGPCYVPLFKPFGIAYATTFGVSFFPNSLHCGSVIGATIIGMGYYTVIWGQIKGDEDDKIKKPCDNSSDSLDKKIPFLQEKVEEEV
ncbi:hypothetical protein L6164_027225 [Bauhinia variegata]|uniref:Uncharacterized protein n=1 Tax=Bauhinia variegata TaxID=167791 RepID=A0ACB9LTE7_BAUVA|nr:hypothetical protein L6164_027225 [Bauhinia variegata]